MAFELVTGHAAEAHITAEQVSRFIQGITVMDDTTVYRLNQGNDAALSVDTLTLTIATGETILHGFHSTNEDALEITLDATTDASYSRIDKIVMEVLQDDTTGYQYTSIITVQGTEAESPTAPDTPSSSGDDTITLLAVGLIATVTVTDSVISAYTDNTELYAGSFVTQEDYEADLGNNDISEIGDGTLTGAIAENANNIGIGLAEVPWYATSSTAASTTAKVATCNQSGFSLVTGAKVIVKFDYTNTATAPTLNVNSTGAIDIVAYGTTAPDLFWVAGDVVEFTYDGTSWVMHPTQGQISELNTNLNDHLHFKFIGQAWAGSSAVTLDLTGYKELLIMGNNTYWIFTSLLFVNYIVNNSVTQRLGQPDQNIYFTISQAGAINFISYTLDGTSYTSGASINVYAR